MQKEKNQQGFAETYGGIFGACLPLIVMLGSILVMAALGMRSTKNFWSAGFFAVVTGFLVYKDKKRFQDAIIEGATDKTFGFMICCFLMAGIMSKILPSSHLVSG